MTTNITTSSNGIVLTTAADSNPVVVKSGVTLTGTATKAAISDGTAAASSAFTIDNYGLLTGGLSMELYTPGDVVDNEAGGRIAATTNSSTSGSGIRIHSGSGTIINAGVISSASHSGVAFINGAQGLVNNQAGGLITGLTQGVYLEGGTLTNAGTITGTSTSGGALGVGVKLVSGTNAVANSGTISGPTFGIDGYAAATASVVNTGTISGTGAAGIGIELRKTGSTIANQSGGTISGTAFGVYGPSTATETVSNAGLIAGTGSAGIGIDLKAGGTVTDSGTVVGNSGTAVYLGGSGNNLLDLQPGASFTGAVEGGADAYNTLEISDPAGGTTALSGLGTQFVNFNAIELDGGVNAVLTGGNTLAAGTYVYGGGTLTNIGTLDEGAVSGSETIAAGGLVNDGTVVVGGNDVLSIGAPVSADAGDAGTFDLDGTGILTFGAAVAPDQTVAFGGDAGTLVLNDSSGFAGNVTGFVVGDGLDLGDLIYSEDATAALSNGTLTVTTDYGTAQIALAVADATTGTPRFAIAQDATGGTLVTEAAGVPCFCRGTRILTARGEVAVEALRVGDEAVTVQDGARSLRPVRWLGHRRMDPRRAPRPDQAHPVHIRAGALAEGVPHRDLMVSPGHRFAFDGALVKAGELVNGAGITQESRDTVEYWHVELDGHAVLIADGAEAESYQDTGNRAGFEGGATTVLHPELDGEAPGACLPLAGPTPGLRERLIRRAEALGFRREGDARPWLEADGQRIEPLRRHDRLRFALPEGCTEARLRSRAQRPRDVNPARDDRRRLGLGLGRLSLCDADGAWWDVALDHPALAEGFSYPERDKAGWTWRWTDGDARLPLAELAPGRTVTAIEITLDQTMRFWAPPARAEGAGDAMQPDTRLAS